MSNLVEGGMGFAQKPTEVDETFDEKINRTATEAARRKFTPEFMNRIDKTWCSRPCVRSTCSRFWNRVGHGATAHSDGFGHQSVRFQLHAASEEFSIARRHSPKYGARH